MPNFSIQGGRALDAGLAALAAASAGFVAFAMPEPLFSSLIEATRLPNLVPAAAPPLGETARLAIVATIALFTFAAIWALMAALGRAPARAALPAEAAAEAETPRLRRADAHPDAPARRPLLARDLGEPLELDQPADAAEEATPWTEAEHRPLPAFLVPQEPEAETEDRAPEAEAEPEPEPQPQAADEPAPDAHIEPEPIAGLAARLPEGGEDADQPLAALVNRIEFGLSRKRQALPAAEPAPADESPAEPEKVGHRLRSAINDLQKIASSGA